MFSAVLILGAYSSYRNKNNQYFIIFISIFFILLGCLWSVPDSEDSIKNFLGKKAKYSFKVISVPQEAARKQTAFVIITKAGQNKIKLKAKLNNFNVQKLKYGSAYLAHAKLTKHHFKEKYFYNLWIKKTSSIDIVNLNLIERFFNSAYFKINGHFNLYLSKQASLFVTAVFLGRRELITSNLRKLFIDSAATHLLAISGLHIGLVSLMVFFLLRLFRIRFKMRIFISITILFLYIVLIGAQASALRAFIMYTVFALGFLFKRKVNIFNSLGFSGFLLLLINPRFVMDLGFQFSFVSVLGIITGFKLFRIKDVKGIPIIRYIKITGLMSLFVMIATAPISSFYFKKVYIMSIFSNIILIPFFTVIIFIAFILIIFSFSPFMSDLIAQALSFFSAIFINTVHFFSGFSCLVVPLGVNLLSICVYYFVLSFLVVWYFNRKKITNIGILR